MFEPTRSPETEAPRPGVRERVAALLAAAADAFSTRLEIFSEEAGQKAAHLGRGFAGFAAALFAGSVVFFLFAALLVSLFTALFGRLWAGILATLLLYGIGAASAALYGWKSLSRVRPLSFPITAAELSEDIRSLKVSFEPVGEDSPAAADDSNPADPQTERSRQSSAMDDFEARFRAGSE